MGIRFGNANAGSNLRVGDEIVGGIAIGNSVVWRRPKSPIYMVGETVEALHTVDRTTGVATRIGSANQFGVGEARPNGLVFHNGTLYMVGATNDFLYTVNTTTGVATRVGSAVRLDIDERVPVGLASHNGVLYVTGSSTRALHSLDTTTGVATRIGSVSDFGIDAAPEGMTSHNGTLYLVARTGFEMGFDGGANLYTLSTSTGRATRVGSATRFGVGERLPSGLASSGGALYMVGETNDALYTINTTTGVGTRIGSATAFGVGETMPTGLASEAAQPPPPIVFISTLYFFEEDTHRLFRLHTDGSLTGSPITNGRIVRPDMRGMFFHNGVLYGTAERGIYTINPVNGRTERWESVSDALANLGESRPWGIAFHNRLIYVTGESTAALYSVNVETEVVSRVGSASLFGVEEFFPTGLASHNNALYMLGGMNAALYTVNPATGFATKVGNATRFGGVESEPRGLTSHNGSLYMSGDGGDRIYTLNSATGVARTIATSQAASIKFGINASMPRGLASADITPGLIEPNPIPPVAYVPPPEPEPPTVSFSGLIMLDSVTRSFYSLNTSTGVATRVGSAVNFGNSDVSIRSGGSLAYHRGTLYMADAGALYSVSVPEGRASRRGNAARFGADIAFVHGLASHGGTLYMLGDNHALNTVSTSTGRAERVGSVVDFGVRELSGRGLASFGSGLYMVGGFNHDGEGSRGRFRGRLYVISSSTGRASQIGSDNFGINENNPQGISFVGSVLYMVSRTRLYTLNTNTGIATRVGNVDNFGANVTGAVGLATI